MSRAEFTTNGTLSQMRAEFGKLAKPPIKTIAKLEKELAAAFLTTQTAVHIITTSLKQSGRTESDFDGDVWEGRIIYGGPSTGPINPVDYAIYEMARGGDHDWLAPATVKHGPKFEQIINQHWIGKKI